jgi:hypothetical protein
MTRSVQRTYSTSQGYKRYGSLVFDIVHGAVVCMMLFCYSAKELAISLIASIQ